MCSPEAPFGRLEVTLVNYKGDISKYVCPTVKVSARHFDFKTVLLSFLQLIANQLTHIEYLYLDDIGYDVIVPNLSKASQLKALQLDEIPITSHSMLKSLLPKLSKLEEISLDGKDYYELLPSIIKMSNFKTEF